MIYETKNITVHVVRVKVSRDSQCSRTLPMTIANIVIVRNIRARIEFG